MEEVFQNVIHSDGSLFREVVHPLYIPYNYFFSIRMNVLDLCK